MFKDFIDIGELKVKKQGDILQLSPLVLAYIGDAVYELFVRMYLINKYDYPAGELHKHAVKFVNAKAQSNVVHLLEKEWDESEKRIIKRGRNQKSGTVPKNASLMDYKQATGFETLIGYLFLTDDIQRLTKIIYKSIELLEAIDCKYAGRK